MSTSGDRDIAPIRPVTGLIVCAFLLFGVGLGVVRLHPLLEIRAYERAELSLEDFAARVQKRSEPLVLSMVKAAEGLAQDPAQDSRTSVLLDRALSVDPSQPMAWALRAAVETRTAGKFSSEAQDYFRKSVKVCPYCEKTLLKWRLEFVLEHWSAAPEDIRLSVFQGADVLRWWHLEYDYLEALLLEAEQAGIPFSAYRRKVGTRVRPEELAG